MEWNGMESNEWMESNGMNGMESIEWNESNGMD